MGAIMEQEWSEILAFIQQILNFTLFELNNTPVTLMSFVIFLVFVGVFAFLSNLLRRFLFKRVLKRFQIDQGMRYTLSRVSQYSVMVIGVLISFQFIGIDLSSLAVIFGLLSVGIGFGLQNLTSNFISGLIVLFERPISVGDRVVVNDIEGDVIEINIRATKVRTVNNVSIIVPNSEFVAKDVVNYSHGDPTYRLDIDVGVSYGSDLDKVLRALKEVADENKTVMRTPPSEVHLTNFGDSAWDMQLRAWIPDVTEYPRVRNELNQAIVHKFRENNIEIPFPQRDLHMKSDAPVTHSE
ncbi:MAG: mechanosensitive ion channel family protein [Bacteroidota bacterium]